MALAKVTIVVGAGIVAAMIPKDVGLPGLSDVFSGAFKVWQFFSKNDHSENDRPSTSDPNTASLLSQVNNLRMELQQVLSSRQQTIVIDNSRSAGQIRIAAVIVIGFGAIGYGYVRWKGLKLSDMMFVTKRGLSDACTNVGKQLDQVSSSVTASKQHLVQRIDRVDCRVDECREITEATKEEVTNIHTDISTMQLEVQSFLDVAQNLANKFSRFEMTQDPTNQRLRGLCLFVEKLESGQQPLQLSQQTQQGKLRALPSTSSQDIGSSSGFSRTISLPSSASEPLRPSPVELPSLEASKVLHRASTITASGLKVLPDIAMSVNTPSAVNVRVSAAPRPLASAALSGFRFKIPGIGSMFSREPSS